MSTSTASRAAMRHGAGRGAGARKRLHTGGDPLGDSQHRRVEPDSARFSIGKPRGRWWAAWMAGAAQRRTVRPDIAPTCCRRVPPATFDIEYFGWVPNPGADRLPTALPAPGPVRVSTRTTHRRSARRRSMLHPGWDRTACRARHAVGQHPPTRADLRLVTVWRVGLGSRSILQRRFLLVWPSDSSSSARTSVLAVHATMSDARRQPPVRVPARHERRRRTLRRTCPRRLRRAHRLTVGDLCSDLPS